MEIQTNYAASLLLAGLRTAQAEGAVISWHRDEGPDYVDIKAETRFNASSRAVFIRCYDSEMLLSVSDIQAVELAAKQSEAHMVLVVGKGTDAIKSAEIEGIGLLPYDSVPNVPPDFWVDVFKPTLLVYGFRFRSDQQRQSIAIPEEPALLAYMMKEMRIVGPALNTTPETLVEQNIHYCASTATSVRQTFTVQLPHATFLIHPNLKNRTPVDTFSFDYRLVPVSELATKEGLGEDPYLLGNTLKDELAKRNSDTDPSQIESGFATKLQFGKYYYKPNLQFSYYCESAKKGKAKLLLLESYQGGHLLQARFEVPTRSASQFVEVTNSKELERLSKLYDRFTISDRNLEGRFTAFVQTVDGCECIDDLDLTPEQERAKKGDYFFDRRTIISEFKSLQTDTSPKVTAILEPYRNTPEWPLLYGEHEIQTVLSFLPNGKEINTRIVNAVTDSIEGIVESANRQFRETKKSFGLPDAGGLLVIFNEVVDVLSPDIIAYRVRKTLRKKTHSGYLRFPHVTVVLIINTGHYSQLTPDLKGMPILVMPSGLPDPHGVEAFASSLLPRWSAFDGQPLFKVKTEDFPKLTFNRFHKREPVKKEHKRYENWRMQYRQAPYLREQEKDEFVTYGRQLFDDIAPRFLKGAPETPANYMAQLMERFTHFLEETAFRRIDLRELIPEANSLKNRLERLYEQYNQPEVNEPKKSRARDRRVSKANKNKIGRGAPCPCMSGKTYSRCHGRKTGSHLES